MSKTSQVPLKSRHPVSQIVIFFYKIFMSSLTMNCQIKTLNKLKKFVMTSNNFISRKLALKLGYKIVYAECSSYFTIKATERAGYQYNILCLIRIIWTKMANKYSIWYSPP